MKPLIAILLFFSIIPSTVGQEKNFEMKSSLSCEELNPSFESLTEALDQITQSEYRFTESFTIRRKKGLKAGDYYSCDNKTGYIVLQINERQIIYFEVPKSEWKGLTQSNDPDNYIQTLIKPNYSSIE